MAKEGNIFGRNMKSASHENRRCLHREQSLSSSPASDVYLYTSAIRLLRVSSHKQGSILIGHVGPRYHAAFGMRTFAKTSGRICTSPKTMGFAPRQSGTTKHATIFRRYSAP